MYVFGFRRLLAEFSEANLRKRTDKEGVCKRLDRERGKYVATF